MPSTKLTEFLNPTVYFWICVLPRCIAVWDSRRPMSIDCSGSCVKVLKMIMRRTEPSPEFCAKACSKLKLGWGVPVTG